MTNTSLQAPDSVLYPLQLLEDFLQTVQPLSSASTTSSRPNDDTVADRLDNTIEAATATTNREEREQVKHVLRVADFLFGSAMEKALLILDSNIVKCVRSIPSGRCIYLISNNNKAEKKKRGGGSGSSEDTSNYFCLLPQQEEGFYFCSCQSFFQRTKSILPPVGHQTSSSEGDCCHDSAAAAPPISLCKHLLALKLLPYLGTSSQQYCTFVEDVTEENFSQHIVQGLLHGRGHSI